MGVCYNVFNVSPKKTLLLPVWPRETPKVWTPLSESKGSAGLVPPEAAGEMSQAAPRASGVLLVISSITLITASLSDLCLNFPLLKAPGHIGLAPTPEI